MNTLKIKQQQQQQEEEEEEEDTFSCHHTNICSLNNNEYDHFVLFIMYVI